MRFNFFRLIIIHLTAPTSRKVRFYCIHYILLRNINYAHVLFAWFKFRRKKHNHLYIFRCGKYGLREISFTNQWMPWKKRMKITSDRNVWLIITSLNSKWLCHSSSIFERNERMLWNILFFHIDACWYYNNQKCELNEKHRVCSSASLFIFEIYQFVLIYSVQS